MPNFDQGSIWRKWDLHVHTPESHLNNQFPANWDDYVQGLFRTAIDRNIAVLGITDYFTIDGYKKLKQEYLNNQAKLESLFTTDELAAIKNMLVLPNIEFRLNRYVGGNSINFHVLFAEDVPIQAIEERFLHDLDFVYEGNPQSTEEKAKLKIANLATLGSKLRAEHEEFQKYPSDLYVGMMSAVVDDSQISGLLEGTPSIFRGKYLMGVVADEDLSAIDWNSKDHLARKVLIQKSDFLFSSNPKTRNWALGRPPYTEGEERFIKEFKTLKPCLHGSDAHELKYIGHACAHRGDKGHACDPAEGQPCTLRTTWIKADSTFEGLRQIIYEPAERVAIQQENPTPLKSKYTLAKFHIGQSTIGSDLSIAETDIPLNSGLVAVTGGKGGGKTAFVDLIANVYKDRCHTEDPNSFVGRISDQNPATATTLEFKDGSRFAKHVCDGTFFRDSDIVYVAQGELEKYIGDNSDLDVYVRSLVFESPLVKDTVKSFEFEQLTQDVAAVRHTLVSKNEVILRLENSTSKVVADGLELELRQRAAELKDVEERIQELAKAQSADKVKLAQEKHKSISELKVKRDVLVGLKNLLASASIFIAKDVAAFNEKIAVINSVLTKLGIAESYSTISYDDKPKLDARILELDKELSSIVKAIETAQSELATFEAEVKDHAKLLDRKAELEAALLSLNEKVEQLKKDQAALAAALVERTKLYERLLRTVSLQRKKYEEIIETFSSHKADVLSDLSFGVRVQFDHVRFLQTASDILDNRRVEVSGKDAPSVFGNLLTHIKELIAGDESKIETIAAEISRLASAYRDKLKNSKAISVASFYGLLYDDYFSVTPTVQYKGTSLSKLSLGQKATVLIKIYLAQGDKPIIIDSHDDHLDNEFIMDELVRAIRQAKTYRQIILASNNGNVVINSDADQIIIANRNDSEISYTAGAMENPMILERAIKVLEGGSDAFRQRKQKYRLQ